MIDMHHFIRQLDTLKNMIKKSSKIIFLLIFALGFLFSIAYLDSLNTKGTDIKNSYSFLEPAIKPAGAASLKIVDVDQLSLSTTPVFLFQDEKLVSQGTGFYYVQQINNLSDLTVVYLVTNYHVLTGSSPAEKKQPIGNNIVFQLHISENDTGMIKSVRYPLFTRSGKNTWINSSLYPEADLAVIPIVSKVYQDAKVSGISAEWAKTNLKVRPTSRVTLIGYPYGFYDKKNELPIWKTGSVASEPKARFDGKPYFLVDVSAFPGMSGSPVFAFSYGMYEMEDGGTQVGYARKFLGIYSSMEMVEEARYLEQISHESNDTKLGIRDVKSLELGFVWTDDLILETIESIDVAKYESEILKDI